MLRAIGLVYGTVQTGVTTRLLTAGTYPVCWDLQCPEC